MKLQGAGESPVKNQSSLAHALHHSIVQDQRRGGHDPYLLKDYDPYSREREPLRKPIIEHVKVDEHSRKFVKGPSCVREKFTSKYWRVWNAEKNLLEDLSKDELQKEHEKRVIEAAKKKRKGKHIPPIKRVVNKDVKVTYFGDPPNKGDADLDNAGYFDQHLLGDVNTPTKMITGCLKQKIPVDITTKNSTYDPQDISSANYGMGYKGGNISGKQIHKTVALTGNCEFLPQGSFLSGNKGTTFTSAARFKKMANKTSATEPIPEDLSAGNDIGNTTAGHVFSQAARFKGAMKSATTTSMSDDEEGEGEGGENKDTEVSYKDATPGPGAYQVPRMFDEYGKDQKERMEDLILKHNTQDRGLFWLSEERKPNLARIAVFSNGCNREEHIRYGMCLDGRCCKRSSTDITTLRNNDLLRLSGYDAVDRMGVKGPRLQEDMQYSQAMLQLLPDAVYDITPLYAAAYKGDVPLIMKLAKLKVNPNVQHPESHYSPLHAAVFRCQTDAVQFLLDEFRGTIRIDLQDLNGDTPLHIASRMGYVPIVTSLCNEERMDPSAKLNKAKEKCIDITKSHKIFQTIKICQDSMDLQLELKRLRSIKLVPSAPSSREGSRGRSR